MLLEAPHLCHLNEFTPGAVASFCVDIGSMHMLLKHLASSISGDLLSGMKIFLEDKVHTRVIVAIQGMGP